MSSNRGVIYIHSAGSALRPHIEWAIGAVLGVPVHLRWAAQPAAPGTHRAELLWTGSAGTAAALADALAACKAVRFEVTRDASVGLEGERYSFTPALGAFVATTNANGDIVVDENRLRAAMRSAARTGSPLEQALENLLGAPWDAELEVFRYAGADEPVRWLHAAV